MANALLNKAKKDKFDEFYTRLEDIEEEIRHYKEHFRNKVVFCNCDDPYESNFFKYFAMNFNHLGLKKLIATCYVGSYVAGRELSLFDIDEEARAPENKHPYKIEITHVEDENGDGAIDLSDVKSLLRSRSNILTLLEGDGDFRSPECVELLKEADIVVTNPPFSLFREYMGLLVENEKHFIIIGNQNNATFKEIFQLLKANKIWLGYNSGDMEFVVPSYYPPHKTRYREEGGIKYRSFGNICWFTNLDIAKRHESIPLYRRYKPEDYPIYDNYDAINIDKVSEIPCDYDGPMGVPITFLEKHNSEQFELLGIASGRDEFEVVPSKRYLNPKQINKDGTVSNGSKANTRATLILAEKPEDIYYLADNAAGPLKILYARVFIKRKGAAQ